MRLDRVWVIYRADSQPAQREAANVPGAESPRIDVVTAMSGPRVNLSPACWL